MRIRRLKRSTTKKKRLLRLLEEYGGSVPLAVAAKELYGRDGRLERDKVVRLLSAYRAYGNGSRMRVKKSKVVEM